MVKMASNWKAEFSNAAGERVYIAAGHQSEMTMDIKTPETFLNAALVEMETMELARSARGPNIVPLRDSWDKVKIDAPVFGINDHEIARADVTDDMIRSAQTTAQVNMYAQPEPKLM